MLHTMCRWMRCWWQLCGDEGEVGTNVRNSLPFLAIVMRSCEGRRQEGQLGTQAAGGWGDISHVRECFAIIVPHASAPPCYYGLWEDVECFNGYRQSRTDSKLQHAASFESLLLDTLVVDRLVTLPLSHLHTWPPGGTHTPAPPAGQRQSLGPDPNLSPSSSLIVPHRPLLLTPEVAAVDQPQ
ncbi:hypothetical protein CC85DRAFT_118289 [Cutaneotrichosporon oleaginosum]|uniref:Uncharacterized protein n=1 Tax=Cutaneotrichosporon oleaginosum TaxID=879819 RepID=A0A0J1B1Q2_9TREE|nr:uncharacterized protein CC85DRAFT_118289 [Cutaneotrichosporon oleaginosum]KLT41554.1 hypothetical protein CC85DRAFT_118289 [Cutaneotrichosporon oleaginosum]TXT09321.1 hypothetical protein COLE_03255 [Cutaneotrichosporon oleaginosum]